MKRQFIKGMGSSAIALLALWDAGAYAQATSAPPVAAEAATAAVAADQGGFQDIIVTARRRAERLQDVPVAATAFTSEQLARYQTSSLQQIAAQTPQLKIGDSGDNGGGVISLRGIGSPSAGPSIDQAVSINVDGIQFSQTQVLRLGLYDIDRVEVLKGPQALFYGKNSPAGVISIISKGPGDHLEASVRGGYEFTAKRKYVEAMVSSPLTETLGVRIDAAYGNQDGWYRNDSKPIPAVPVPAFLGGKGQLTDAGYGTTQPTGQNQRDYFIRGTLAYKTPSGFFDATLKASYGKIDRDNGIGGVTNQFISCPRGAPQYVVLLGSQGSTDCKLDRYYNEPDIPAGIRAIDPRFSQNDGKQFFYSNQFLTSATLNFHLNDHLTLTSVSGFYDLKENFSGNFSLVDLSFVEQVASVHLKQFSQEMRLLSSYDSPINFMLGGYYQHVDNSQASIAVFGSPLIEAFTGGFLQGYQVAVNNRERQKTEAYSFFGQAIVDITPEIQITAGGRYSHETKRISGDSLTPQVFLAADVLDIPITFNNRSFNNFSPEVTATYKPMTSLTLYAAYRTGFKSGGFDLNSGTIQFGATKLTKDISFDQEKVKGFEFGAKGNLFDHQMIFDFAVYRYKYSGLQVSAFDATTLGYRITNAAEAIAKGAELSAQLRPREMAGFSLRTAISWNDTTFGNFKNAPCYTGQSIVGGCAFLATAAGPVPIAPGQVGALQDLSGRPLGRAPKWNGTIGASFDHEVFNGYTIALATDGIYGGSYFASPALDPRSLQKEAWRLNASIALRGPQDRWQISLIGTNLTQELRAVNAYGLVGTGSGTGTANAVFSDLIGSPSEARTVALQAMVKF